MKFHIDKHILLKPLEQVSNALSSKTTIPIMTGILFSANHNGLTITAGNTSIFMKGHIAPDDFELTEVGSIVLDGKQIIEIVKKVDDEISVEVNNLDVKIRSGKSKFELSGLDPEEYPQFPDVKGERIILPALDLRKLIDKTLFATSTNETLPILTGLHFLLENQQIVVTGTDRHRLSRTVYKTNSSTEMSTVLANVSLKEFVKVIDKGEVEISIENDRFLAKTKGITFFSKVLVGKYPDVDSMITGKYKTIISANLLNLTSALERVSIIAREEKTHLVRLAIGTELEFSAKSGGKTAIEVIEIDKILGDDFLIGLNAKFLLEALKAISGERVRIHFTENISPIIITAEGNDDDLHLILPYRITG